MSLDMNGSNKLVNKSLTNNDDATNDYDINNQSTSKDEHMKNSSYLKMMLYQMIHFRPSMKFLCVLQWKIHQQRCLMIKS